MQDSDMDMQSKLQSLIDLISQMKGLHAQGLQDDSQNPKGEGIEIHEIHAEPLNQDDIENLEEATHMDLDNDNEEGESPEHKAAVLGPDNNDQDDEDNNDMSQLKLPPALLQLLAQHLSQNK